MHLIDLGILKKMLTAMSKNKIIGYSVNVTKINNQLAALSKNCPSEFSRTIRTLEDLALWKATEFRQFLLYTGIVVLKGSVHEDIYYHFLLLHSFIRLLSCKNSCQQNSDVAGEMLKEFVKIFPSLYGKEQLSFNVHCLLHLPGGVAQFGTLDSFSAYKFENYMQYLKRLIRKPNKILQQLHRRLKEINTAKYIPQLSKFNAFDINFESDHNSYCCIKGNPMKIVGFGKIENRDTVFGFLFNTVSDYFHEPVKSSSALGIVTCSKNYNTELNTFFKEEILYK